MSQVIKDIEEALKREISKLMTYHRATKTSVTIQTTFDPITGEAVKKPLEANFYFEDSMSNAVEYPRVDISFDQVQEDRTSGRMISIWEFFEGTINTLIEPNQLRPQVFEQIVSGRNITVESDGIIVPAIDFTRLSIGNVIKLVTGANKGHYIVKDLDNFTKKLILDEDLVKDIQEISFNTSTRKLYLLNNRELNTVRSGDTFVDSLGAQFTIVSIDIKKRELLLSGSAVPDLSIGSKITRLNGVLNNVDGSDVFYIAMDQNKPLFRDKVVKGFLTDRYLEYLDPTPFNYTYTIEVKNNERTAHIEVAERFTETFINRTRRAIQILLRCPDSAETDVTCGTKTSGDNRTIKVEDASCFCVNDSVYIANNTRVSENNQIIDVDYENNLISLRNYLPYDFDEGSVLVSNAELRYWSLFLNEGLTIMTQDNVNNFYRQQYTIRIEGWKAEKAGKKETVAIHDISGTIETENNVVEEFE